jgi:predicted transcriptional regulator
LQGLGFNWFIIVIEETGLSMKYAKQVFDSYRPEGQILTAKDIVEKHLYVTSDRKFAYEHGLMADMANSPQYSQALLLNKAGYHIEKWRKSMKGPLTDTAKYHIDITKYLIEMSLNISLQLDYIHDFLGITRNDFKILSYLYIKQHTFVDYAQIFQRFSDNLNLHKVTGCIRRLSQAGMIVKTPKTMERKYQITALGIKGIADFYKQILKANEF